MSLARPLAPALLLALLSTSGTARSEPSREAASCQPSRGTLAFLGCSVAQQLGPPAVGASAVVVDLKSDRELAAPGALRARLQSAVTTALREGAAAPPGAKPKLQVELRVEKSGGVLRVTAELRRATGLWQRVRHRKSEPEQRAFVEAPLDAELRVLIPPPPLVVSETLKLKSPERGIVALACGPLGVDGGQELVLVSRSSVRVGRIAGGAFVERKRVAWSALSPIAPTPLREAIGVATLTPAGLRVGLSDRKDGLELSRELAVKQRFEERLPLTTEGCAGRAALGVFAQVLPCSQPGGAVRSLPATLDAVAGASTTWLGRELATGKLVASSSASYALRVGAQLALGDADSDGALELAYSVDTPDAAKDRLTLVTLQGDKSLPRFELAAPGISAIAICQNREGPGMAPVVVATGDELWLLR